MRVPTPSQAKAISHINGPAVLIAGPGSGKTFTVIERIRNLIQKAHILPDNILVVTFSKAAASEMYERYRNFPDLDEGVHFGTFHSLAYSILKDSFGFPTDSLINESKKKNMLFHIFQNHGYGNVITSENLIEILNSVSKIKNSSQYQNYSFNSEFEEITDEELNQIISEYFEFLNENGNIDFDDMIIKCLEKLTQNKGVLSEYQQRFKYILVDEFQDINKPQYDLIRLLCAPINNIFVVGDDDQAIYGFRGSEPGIMKKFTEDFPESKIIYLTENFRSPDKIVSFAQKIISENHNRFIKEFVPKNTGGIIEFEIFDSRKEEENKVVSLVKNIYFEEYEKTAIILRTNRDVAIFKALLKNNNIPVAEKVKESKTFFDSSIFTDMVSFLKFVFEGRSRKDFIRFMNKPNKYIQRVSLTEKVEETKVLEFYSNNESMRGLLQGFFKKLNLASGMSAKTALTLFRKTIGYDRYLKENSKNSNEYENNLKTADECVKFFSELKKGIPVDEYIEEGIKKTEIRKGEEVKISGINVITMHSSKGLEFLNVIIPDVNEGIIPSKKSALISIEEERRLFYVSLTRAQKKLYILATRERNREISRFIRKFVEK